MRPYIPKRASTHLENDIFVGFLFKGMCGGPRCTILMHVNAYDLWCCVHVIPLNQYIFQEWKITKIFKGTSGVQDTMLWTPTHPLNIHILLEECKQQLHEFQSSFPEH